MTERTRLLSAALQVLRRSGWWGFKVESVLRAAGLSTRSFYRHFATKNELLLALMEHELGGAAIALEQRTARGRTPSDKVRAYITATIDMAYRAELAEPSSLFASQLRELLSMHHEEVRACYKKMLQPLISAITEGVATGELTSDDPNDDAAAVFYLVAGMTADQAAAGCRVPRERVEHIVMSLITRGLGMQAA